MMIMLLLVKTIYISDIHLYDSHLYIIDENSLKIL